MVMNAPILEIAMIQEAIYALFVLSKAYFVTYRTKGVHVWPFP